MKNDLIYLDTYTLQQDMRLRLPKSVLSNMNIEKGKTKLEIFFDKEDNLFLGTAIDQILPWDFYEQKPVTQQAIDTGSLVNIHDMFENADGYIWICSDSGVGYYGENRIVIPMNT